jgi:hypothetical protein
LKKALAALAVCLLAPAVPAPAQMPPMPQPGPEHEMLKKDVGTWDATVEFFMAPGAPPAVSKGTETVTMLGGFWQVNDFKSEMMGMPFEGRGATGYDPATKTMTAMMEGPDPSGAIVKTKETTEWKDADTRVFTMYAPDGQSVSMRITYKRRK